MHSISLQQITEYQPVKLINRNHQPADNHEKLRDAVRAWSGRDGQDAVAALIVSEWRAQGGSGIDFPQEVERQRQKLFRYLDNKFSSDGYRRKVEALTPAILAVLPLEFRGHVSGRENFMALLADAEREIAEAKQAVMLNAPEHQKLKEVSEGIASLFRLMPEQAGQLMALVTTMLGAL